MFCIHSMLLNMMSVCNEYYIYVHCILSISMQKTCGEYIGGISICKLNCQLISLVTYDVYKTIQSLLVHILSSTIQKRTINGYNIICFSQRYFHNGGAHRDYNLCGDNELLRYKFIIKLLPTPR